MGGEGTRRIARDVERVWASGKEDSDQYQMAEYQIGVAFYSVD